MKLELLTKALQHYVLSAECSESDRQHVFDAISECNQLSERFDSKKIWQDTIYIVSAESMSDLLNMATYDIYGKLAKVHGDELPFEYFAHAVRKEYLPELTNCSLELIFDILSDLWRDNEANGAHNPDGTFMRD